MTDKFFEVTVQGYVEEIIQDDLDRSEHFQLIYQQSGTHLRIIMRVHAPSIAYAVETVVKTVQGVFWNTVWLQLVVQAEETADVEIPHEVPV